MEPYCYYVCPGQKFDNELFSTRLQFSKSFRMTLWLLLAMLAAGQCVELESSQQPAQIIGIRQIEATDEVHSCSPSSSTFPSTCPIEAENLVDSSGTAHSPQDANHLSNQQGPHELAISIDDPEQEYSIKGPWEGISIAQTAASDHQSISIIPETSSCSICLDEETEGAMTQLDCPHQFHTECIRKWLIVHKTCPQCRRKVAGKTASQIVRGLSPVELKSVIVARLPNTWDSAYYTCSGVIFLTLLYCCLHYLHYLKRLI
ncbi:hypothetical protein PGT21_021405 [Puccinia graminis f. sp. tritici]|uniref:RING-type E3 ubiquitin transferase n=1 Tax=Puccinia graminis f. sp. tritici TaxID=56615 RepID=A0A5B0MNS8_PUCGR|nr:hypothetical protein PGTUg99_014310 [Puccinia graminis f. sp. tritici]KAA1084221.1 hypothetical protein PGT21_021405 [Puccinia graminis f. sp. tritici]